MATITRYVNAPSGAGSLNGTDLDNAYASIIDVQTEDPATGADDLVIELYGGTDDPGARLQFAPTGNSVTINVRSSSYQLDNTADFRDGIEINRGCTFAGDYPFRSRTSASPSPNAGISCVGNTTGTIDFTNLR